jgi:cell wall assembly regulator SMI1
MRALPVAEILDTWQMLRELLDDEEWAAQPPYYFTEEVLRLGEQPGPIQPVWWHPRWIPLAMDNAGNLTCLDMAPAPGGVVGQIIDWDHECGPSRVLFPNFHHLLRAFSEQLEGASDKQST